MKMNPANIVAMIGAPGMPLIGMVASGGTADHWLSIAIKVFGCVGGACSLWWMWNKLERWHKLVTMCKDCIDGYPPQGPCPLTPNDRPVNCPKNRRTL